MQRIYGRIKDEWIFIITSLIYAITVLILFPFLGFYADNPDTISYITIARKYVHADFSNAINGYWSPMISWVLGLFLKMGVDEMNTFRVLQVFIGWFAILNFVRLVKSIVHSQELAWFLSLVIIPFVICYSLLNLTPDLLFLTVILFYLRIVSEKEFFNHRHFGLIAGVIGVLIYFSKSFGLCFFIAHFTVLFLKIYFQTNEFAFKRHLIKNYFQALFCFLCISSIWIYLVSDKYGHFTISENVSYNLSREVAAIPGEENKLPVLSGGLNAPVNSSAVNAWEDPGVKANVHPLHPFSSISDFHLYREVLKRNLLTIYYFDFRRQIGLLFAIILILFLVFGKRKRIFSDDYFFSLFLAIILFYGGYSLILVHTRYVWVCTLIMILLSAWLVEELLSSNKKQQVVAKFFFVILVFVLAVKRPVKEILFGSDKQVELSSLVGSLLHPFKTMDETYLIDKKLFDARKSASAIIQQGSNIVSVKNSSWSRDGYAQASYFALSTNSKYLGQIAESDSTPDQLTRSVASHIIFFSVDDSLADTLRWRMIFKDSMIPLKIYGLKIAGN